MSKLKIKHFANPNCNTCEGSGIDRGDHGTEFVCSCVDDITISECSEELLADILEWDLRLPPTGDKTDLPASRLLLLQTAALNRWPDGVIPYLGSAL